MTILGSLAVAAATDTFSASPVIATATLFGAGVLTSLNPCIYPMIPITAGVIAASARGGESAERALVTGARRRARIAGLTFTYVAGLALFYALLGLIAGLTGSLFGTVSASPWARLATGSLLLIFALAMLDVFQVRVPERLGSWAASRGGGSYPAVFLLGATSGVVAAPCGAPAFAAVLTWVGTTQSAGLGFLYLFSFSLGMTALLVLVGLFSGTITALPKPGRWMLRVRRAAGILILIMAQYYFVQAGMVW
jgi:cytochrome c-type biogenesis protein